jgi:hypothetical protein
MAQRARRAPGLLAAESITLVQLVRSCVRTLAILVCVDGLASYVMASLRVFGV